MPTTEREGQTAPVESAEVDLEVPSPAAEDAPRTAPYRLSDLSSSHRRIAALLAALLVLPIIISGVRAVSDDWRASGDEALIVVKTLDVFSSDPPLVGQPSTSKDITTFHPGPIEFFLFAIPVQILGIHLGTLLGAGIVNAVAVLVAAWVVFRRAGPTVGLAATVLLGCTMWSQGSAILTDTISSNMGGYSLLAFAVLAWALSAGDVRLLPLTIAVGSWTGQQHLAMLIPVLVMTMWAVGTLAWRLVQDRRNGREPDRPVLPWLLAGAGLGVVLWAPVLIEELTGDPGNITAIIRLARHGDRPTLGPASGLRQAARALSVPPVFTRTDLRGNDLWAPIGPLAAAIAAAVAVTLVAIGVRLRRHAPDLAMMAFTTLVLAVAGVWNGSNVVATLEKSRIAFYRWTYPTAILAWLALGWAAARVLLAWRERRQERPEGNGTRLSFTPASVSRVSVSRVSVSRVSVSRVSVSRVSASRVAVPLAVVLLAAVAGNAVIADERYDQRRDAAAFGIERDAIAALEAELDGDDGPYLLITQGTMSSLTLGPALAVELVDKGVEIQVDKWNTAGYGSHRAYRPGTVKGAIVVLSSKEPIEAPPGEQIYFDTFDDSATSTREKLAEQVRNADVVVSPEGDELIEDLPPAEQLLAETIIATPDGYADLLLTDFGLHIVQDGYFEQPRLDPDDLKRALEPSDKPLTIWNNDRAGIWILTPQQLEQWDGLVGEL
jgi:hypothetical protein